MSFSHSLSQPVGWEENGRPTRARTCIGSSCDAYRIEDSESAETKWTHIWTQIVDAGSPELAFLVESWSLLSEDTKAAILAITHTSLERRFERGS